MCFSAGHKNKPRFAIVFLQSSHELSHAHKGIVGPAASSKNGVTWRVVGPQAQMSVVTEGLCSSIVVIRQFFRLTIG